MGGLLMSNSAFAFEMRVFLARLYAIAWATHALVQLGTAAILARHATESAKRERTSFARGVLGGSESVSTTNWSLRGC